MKKADMNSGTMSLSPGVGTPYSPDQQQHPFVHSLKRTVIGSMDDIIMAAGRVLRKIPKEAQAAVPTGENPVDKPTPQEYDVRRNRIRKIMGTIIGGGYGAAAGGMLGGTVFGHTRPGFDAKPGFDKQQAIRGMILGALGGGGLGFAAGTAMNHVKQYTGEHDKQPTIQIVVPPSPEVMQEVTDAIKSGSALVRTAAIFAGMKQADMNPMKNLGEGPLFHVRPPGVPKIPTETTGEPGTMPAPKQTAGAQTIGPNSNSVKSLLGGRDSVLH